MAVFPTTIRAPVRAGWTMTEADGVRRTQMDGGPDKTRVATTALPQTETLRWKLPADQAVSLRDFYAANKADKFDFTHPKWGACLARFLGPLRWSEDGLFEVAEGTLEIWEV
jgi:hypothetical protein